MKKIISFIIIGYIICSAFNKPTIFFDYRDTYVGNYFCNSTCARIKTQTNDPGSTSDTLTITISKVPVDSILKITIGQNTYQVKFKNNILYSFPLGGHYGGKFFASDSISFTSSAGMGSLCSYTGKKK